MILEARKLAILGTSVEQETHLPSVVSSDGDR